MCDQSSKNIPWLIIKERTGSANHRGVSFLGVIVNRSVHREKERKTGERKWWYERKREEEGVIGICAREREIKKRGEKC